VIATAFQANRYGPVALGSVANFCDRSFVG
jgi:hypothetical protein